MKALLGYAMMFVALVGGFILIGNWYFQLPIVHLDADTKQCIRVLVPEREREVKKSCRAMNLQGRIYLTEYVVR